MNRKLLECRQAFTMNNNMASFGLRENIILNKINNAIDGPIVCKEGYLVPKFVAPNGGVWDPIHSKH